LAFYWRRDLHRIGESHDTEALVSCSVINPDSILGFDVLPIHVGTPLVVYCTLQEHFFERSRTSI
jgi:hypothetical protein